MPQLPKHFSRKELPFNQQMNSFWKENGFIIIDNFYSSKECEKLRKRTKKLVENFDYSSHKTIVNSKQKQHAKDKYFLETGDKIRFFLMIFV